MDLLVVAGWVLANAKLGHEVVDRRHFHQVTGGPSKQGRILKTCEEFLLKQNVKIIETSF